MNYVLIGTLIMNGCQNKYSLVSVIAFASIAFASNGSASIPYDRPVDELYKDTPLIVRGRIVGISASCTDSTCTPTKYTLKLLSIIKGPKGVKENSELVFCAEGDLSIGSRYVLFLNEGKGIFQSDDCRYNANHDGMFMPVGDKTYFRVWSGKAYEIFTYKDEMRKAGNTYFTFGIEVPDFLDLIDKAKGP